MLLAYQASRVRHWSFEREVKVGERAVMRPSSAQLSGYILWGANGLAGKSLDAPSDEVRAPGGRLSEQKEKKHQIAWFRRRMALAVTT